MCIHLVFNGLEVALVEKSVGGLSAIDASEGELLVVVAVGTVDQELEVSVISIHFREDVFGGDWWLDDRRRALGQSQNDHHKDCEDAGKFLPTKSSGMWGAGNWRFLLIPLLDAV